MGFTSGSVTFRRYRANQNKISSIVEDLEQHKIGSSQIASADGIDCGWGAGKHILDAEFSAEKNYLDDFAVFDFVVERTRLPGDKLKAYYEVELTALTKDNPSGFPSARQKREAKEIARERVEQEASDGRYKKRQAIPVCWDVTSGWLLFGATSATHLLRFESLFEKTFGVTPFPMTANSVAVAADAVGGRDLFPSEFVAGITPQDFAWAAGDSRSDWSWMGNEFMLWLWWYFDVIGDTFIAGGAFGNIEITGMIARTLGVDCPRGQSGRDTFNSEGPARLPEARRAIKSGKLPRQAGLTLVRQGEQYEFKLQAETLMVSGGKVPKADEGIARDRVIQRLNSIRDMNKAIDDLYGEFLKRRLSPRWVDDVVAIREWLGA